MGSQQPSGVKSERHIVMENYDASLISNIIVQLFAAIGMFCVYCTVRKRAPWVYFPNSRNSPEHPGYSYNGSLNWMKAVFTANDTTLLAVTGLDGFMFLQTLRLLYTICFILGVTFTPILCSFCYFHSTAHSWFSKLSIVHVSSTRTFWIAIPLIYLTSGLVFYLVFIYYKRYTSLRQLFLASPSSMTSVGKLKKIASSLPANCTAMEYIDVRSRTVLLSCLPAKINSDSECMTYVRVLGIGEVEDAVLIRGTYRLQRLYEERDAIVQRIEKEVHRIFWMMEREFREKAETFGYMRNMELQAAAERESGSGGNPGTLLPLEERVRRWNVFCVAAMRYTTNRNTTTNIAFHMAEFKENAVEIGRERERVRGAARNTADNSHGEHMEELEAGGGAGNSGSGEDADPTKVTSYDFIFSNGQDQALEASDEDPGSSQENTSAAGSRAGESRISVGSSIFIPGEIEEDTSFLSLWQCLHPRRYRHIFSLDIPYDRPRAFVTFKDARTAAVAVQAKIGTRVFSCKAESAPSPHDIIWKNVSRGEVGRFVSQILSFLFFIALNVFFFVVAIRISSLLRSPSLLRTPVFKTIQNYPKLKALYVGNIEPLVTNVLLFFVPILITAVLNLEGIISYSYLQARMMNVFSYFLFFNGFLVLSVYDSLFEVISSLYSKENSVEEVFGRIVDTAVKTSHTLCNIIIQRLFVGNMMVFLKPGPFLFNFFVSPFISKTQRQQREIQFSPPVDFGNAIPNALLIFPMVVVYMCFSPFMPVIGLVFYVATYITYKNELLYASLNDYESGGIYWCESARFIIYSLGMMQVVFVSYLYINGRTILALSVVPLLVLSYLFWSELSAMFERSSENYPLNEPEEAYLDEFCAKAVSERAQILRNWKAAASASDSEQQHTDQQGLPVYSPDILSTSSGFPDVLPLAEPPKGAKNVRRTFYRDPALAANACELMLPRGFFSVIRFLETHDREGRLGFR